MRSNFGRSHDAEILRHAQDDGEKGIAIVTPARHPGSRRHVDASGVSSKSDSAAVFTMASESSTKKTA